MMSDETAKALIEAINRFAGALERLQGGSGALGGGIQVHHHGLQHQMQPYPVYMPFPLAPYTSCNNGVNQ